MWRFPVALFEIIEFNIQSDYNYGNTNLVGELELYLLFSADISKAHLMSTMSSIVCSAALGQITRVSTK